MDGLSLVRMGLVRNSVWLNRVRVWSRSHQADKCNVQRNGRPTQHFLLPVMHNPASQMADPAPQWDTGMARKLEEWIAVVDGDHVSGAQMDTCRALHVPLRGAIECHKPENENAEVCNKVPYFPAFCHTGLNQCVYGLRKGVADFEALATAIDPQHTTPLEQPQKMPAEP